MPSRHLTHASATWLDLVSPSTDDVASLRARYPQFHPLNLEDIRSHIERPKLDQDDDYLFLVMHFPRWDAAGQVSRASEVDIFLGRDFVITVHDGSLKPLTAAFQRCLDDSAARENLLGRGANHALYTLLDQLVDYIFPIMGKVDARVAAIGDALFESNAKRTIRELALLRRDIISLRRIIRAQIPILLELETVPAPHLARGHGRVFWRYCRPPVQAAGYR